MVDEYFSKHVDKRLDNELNTNQCNPNLSYRMIVGMPFQLVPGHGMYSTTREKNNFFFRIRCKMTGTVAIFRKMKSNICQINSLLLL